MLPKQSSLQEEDLPELGSTAQFPLPCQFCSLQVTLTVLQLGLNALQMQIIAAGILEVSCGVRVGRAAEGLTGDVYRPAKPMGRQRQPG